MNSIQGQIYKNENIVDYYVKVLIELNILMKLYHLYLLKYHHNGKKTKISST